MFSVLSLTSLLPSRDRNKYGGIWGWSIIFFKGCSLCYCDPIYRRVLLFVCSITCKQFFLPQFYIFNLYFVQFPVQRFPPWIIYAISVRQYWTRRLAPWPQMIRLIPRLIHWEKTWWSPKENTFNEIETLLRLFEKGNKLTCRIFRTFFKIFGNKFEIFGKKKTRISRNIFWWI